MVLAYKLGATLFFVSDVCSSLFVKQYVNTK